MHSFLLNQLNIAVSHILQNSRFFGVGLHFSPDNMGLALTRLLQLALELTS